MYWEQDQFDKFMKVFVRISDNIEIFALELQRIGAKITELEEENLEDENED